METILVCDDDKAILDSIEIYLKLEGYHVLKAEDGIQALELIQSNEIHCLVLDIMMPRMDGLQTTLKIRENYNFPIIMLSAKSEDTDKIAGLGFGADDYVTKPFNPLELVARVKAHISRYNRLTHIPEPVITTYESLKLNNDSGEAFYNDVNLNLTKKEFELLKLMISKPDTVFTKNELFSRVWGYDSLGDTSTLTVHINRLRDKLKEIAPDTDFIKTIWGRGYRLK